MAEHIDEDLSGARFERVRLNRARFHDVDLTGARFREVLVRDVQLRGAWIDGLDIDGEVKSLTVNGIDVVPLVEAELRRTVPGYALLKPPDAEGFRAAWASNLELWARTVDHARSLPPELLHERVDDEWSFIETLRHLVFATDAWVRRAYQGDPSPYHPLGLAHTDMEPADGVPHDPDARPALEEMLAVRADRMAGVGEVFAELTDERLEGTTDPVLEPGYPESEAFAVRRALGAIINEEFHHRRFAERDLAVLEARLRAETSGTTDS